VTETLDIVRASERLRGLAMPLRSVIAQVASVRDVAPVLDPELNAIEERVLEALDHVIAATAVLNAQLDLMSEHVS